MEHQHGPDCNHDDDFSTEELVEVTEDKVDALINLLLKKGVISEDELHSAFEELYEEGPDGDDEDEDDEE